MANSFPGSGLAYADQFSVGTATASGLLTLKAEVTNTPTLVFLNSSGGPNSAISNFTSATQTFTAIGANFVINSTANTVRLNTSYEGSGITFDEGLLRFYTGTSGINPDVRMAIKNNGNIGIGTTSPVGKLDIVTGGSTNIVISNDSTDTNYNIVSLNGTRTKGSYAGIAGGGSGDNKLYLNSGDAVSIQTGASYTERMRITVSGSVGINTSSPGTYKLNVNGTFYSAGSSLEYKTEISTFDADTNKILELRPVTYQYKDEYKHLGKELKSGTQIGLIAEEVAEVFPELAMMKEDEDGETRVRNVDYEKLSILLLSEVQKLRKEVNELKNK